MVPSAQSTTDGEDLAPFFSPFGLEFLGTARVPADPQARSEAEARYADHLARGDHGTMAFLENHRQAKYNPHLALEGTQSILVVGLNYFQESPPIPEGQGRTARYAWGRDYHKVLLGKLHQVVDALDQRWPGHGWRSFTDTAPLDERWWAARAGAAFTGRNALSIHRTLGSWFFLGEILTTRAFEPTGPRDHRHGACPSGCRRCRDACPTGALDAAGNLEARRCISYLTIEHRGPIDEGLKDGIGPWTFGCDLCQEACPLNLGVKPTTEPQFLGWKAGPSLDPGEILLMDQEAFTARFGGSPVHRARREGLVRNACLTAAHRGRTDLIPPVRALTSDPDPGVADAARWALAKLTQGPQP